MSTLNKIILVGYLAEDPDMKATNQGDSMAKFTLVVDRPDRSDGAPKQSDNIAIIAWGQIADLAAPLSKGQTTLVEGRVISRSFDDMNGQRKWVTEVEARDIKGLSGVDQTPVAKPSPKKSSLEKSKKAVEEEAFDFSNQSLSDTDLQFPSGFGKELDEEIPF